MVQPQVELTRPPTGHPGAPSVQGLTQVSGLADGRGLAATPMVTPAVTVVGPVGLLPGVRGLVEQGRELLVLVFAQWPDRPDRAVEPVFRHRVKGGVLYHYQGCVVVATTDL